MVSTTPQPYQSAEGPAANRYLVGVDIGGTKIETVLLSAEGGVLGTHRIPARRGNEAVVNDIIESVRHITEPLGTGSYSVGIGIPGQIDSATGTVYSAVNLDIEELALGPAVTQGLNGTTVKVENDVNVAALGASHLTSTGNIETDETTVFINLGTGLAAGVIHNGTIVHGDTGICGEVGHIPVEPHQLPCACGQHGCLETVASGGAIQRLWPNAEGPALPDLIDKADAGNNHAKEVLAMVLDAQTTAIIIVGLCIDPSSIIIGGGAARTGTPLLLHLKETLRKRAKDSAFLVSTHLDDRIHLAPIGKPIGAIGAALAGRTRDHDALA